MKISELNEAQKQHLVWRLDHKTFMGLLTARRIVRGEKGDLDLVEVFKLAERSDRSAKIHARKVIDYAGNPIPYGGMGPSDAIRVMHALAVIKHGVVDGDHHKMWFIDQMLRALTGCPIVKVKATDVNDKSYTYLEMGESPQYRIWVENFERGEDGPRTYEWDIGVAP